MLEFYAAEFVTTFQALQGVRVSLIQYDYVRGREPLVETEPSLLTRLVLGRTLNKARQVDQDMKKTVEDNRRVMIASLETSLRFVCHELERLGLIFSLAEARRLKPR